jgi:CheY-like chemotaxis protein
MGERILSDEGYEVVTVSNADSALIRLDDVDPDVVLADTVMPGRTGYEICQYLKMSPRHRYVRVILTAGVLEAFDEERARQVSADGTLKKPFEASALVSAVKPLAEAAAKDRASASTGPSAGAVVDSEQVRAAVIVALDAAHETMVDEITRRVLAAMRSGNAEPRQFEQTNFEQKIAEPRLRLPQIAEPAPPEPLLAPHRSDKPKLAAPAPPPEAEPVRRVNPLRIRSGSILGLDYGRPEPPAHDPE